MQVKWRERVTDQQDKKGEKNALRTGPWSLSLYFFLLSNSTTPSYRLPTPQPRKEHAGKMNDKSSTEAHNQVPKMKTAVHRSNFGKWKQIRQVPRQANRNALLHFPPTAAPSFFSCLFSVLNCHSQLLTLPPPQNYSQVL